MPPHSRIHKFKEFSFHEASRYFLQPEFAEGNDASLAVVLQGDEALLPAHFLVVIDHGGEHNAVDLVSDLGALCDDFHSVPLMLLEV